MENSKEDRVGPIVAAFMGGMLIVAFVVAIWGPDRDAIRVELQEEVRAEYVAERTLRENEIALENLVWAIKRIDKDLDEIWDRLEIADILDKSRADLVEDLK